MASKKGRVGASKGLKLAERLFETHLRQLRRHVEREGVGGLERLYKAARGELLDKLSRVPSTGSEAHQLRALLDQADAVILRMGKELEGHLRDVSGTAAELGASHAVDEYRVLAEHFTGTTPVLDLDSAGVLSGLASDVESSLLRRYSIQAQRWSVSAVESMERRLAVGTMAKKPLTDLIDDVMGAEGFDRERWKAEQIVRTEQSYAASNAKQRAMEATRDELAPELQKRLIETFDDRTGDDSFILHGQTVPVGEPFAWKHRVRGVWTVTEYMHPPNRPNDRAVVIPWDPSWEASPDEKPLSKAELAMAAPTRWRDTIGVKIPPGHRPGKRPV